MKKHGKEVIIKMNKKQYNNVIDWTLTHDQSAQTEDSLKTARAIFKNMGVALPQGDLKEVSEVLKTDDYMGWKSCTMPEAQAAADKGIAAIGISEDKIVVLSATDEEQPVATTAAVMTLSDTAAASTVSDLAFYSYNSGTTIIEKTLYFENEELSVTVGWQGYNPLRGSCTDTIYWSSTNSAVASVNRYNGEVLAKSVGTAVITAYDDCGCSASYELVVKEKVLFSTIEKTVTVDALGAGYIVPQAYPVTISMWCAINRVDGNNVMIESISVFATYKITMELFDVSLPSLAVGTTKLGEQTLNLIEGTGEHLLPDRCVYEDKTAYVNSWVPLGTNLSTMACLFFDSSVFPYRQVDLVTQINL